MAGKPLATRACVAPAQFVAFSIPCEAVPWARAGSNGKARFTKPVQARFMIVVGQYCNRAMAGKPPLTGPVEMQVRAIYVAPKSWDPEKRDTTLWKTSPADCDNIAKLVGDALNGIAYMDDAQIAHLVVQKIYGLAPELIVSVAPCAGRVSGEAGR